MTNGLVMSKVARLLRPHSRSAFINSLPNKAMILDVGCGNGSVDRVKNIRPDIYYVGVDINESSEIPNSAFSVDEYIEATPESFGNAVASAGSRFDAVISSHNIEHCNDPEQVVSAMASTLKPGGRLFMSFPAAETVTFPSRSGTLNFADDPTHIYLPDWEAINHWLMLHGLKVTKAIKRHRPLVYSAVGMAIEPVLAHQKRVDGFGFSWAYWGFESVIWAEKSH